MKPGTKRVVIVGGGFAGLRAARSLGDVSEIDITLVDQRNHHLFQPLLYQVAMAGLSPAEIAAPIRSLLSRYQNIRVLQERVDRVDLTGRRIVTRSGEIDYDTLLLACGARHAYFGHDDWEEHAPGLKTLEQATEIRRRVLSAFEEAEREADPERRRALLTFVVVGGGPTGVELAGALGEMSRFTLARDFRNIDPKLTRVILVEAGPRILPSFREGQASRATRDLESLGVEVWTASPVTRIDAACIEVGRERIETFTALWAAGVEPSALNRTLGVSLDAQGRVLVGADLSLPGHPEVFVAGDQAHFSPDSSSSPLPGHAPVAMQQGRFFARTVRRDLRGEPRERFRYVDRGQMATIGRRRAICEIGRFHFGGWFAWITWLVVHIYYLVGFKNRLFVVLQWTWSYLRYGRGARLIIAKEWRFYSSRSAP
ncbi:MAG: NAD(P)/FAD-dependent oxidoreductase [Myxococcota bacterium]